ncbi:hypothetical protein A0H81_06655 [Grifola frondosa]|uniref:Uncharacterized protein n=1 Tax=Grifola frondosa TaxID=5627 RepID=A0A1C7M882_GRIFR|nr:hypothetical protein A0H81_06655 [Grifola frondosa]
MKLLFAPLVLSFAFAVATTFAQMDVDMSRSKVPTVKMISQTRISSSFLHRAPFARIVGCPVGSVKNRTSVSGEDDGSMSDFSIADDAVSKRRFGSSRYLIRKSYSPS